MNESSSSKHYFISDTLVFIAFPTICCLLVILFKQLRRQFPVKVNCWFCNQNTSLAYDDRNNFTCPSCHQYNGFTEDGDYNKVIPEQRDELLNHIVSPRKLTSVGTTNGLCQICNNNQQLLIYQLARFEPMDDDNYDAEIEHFQKQLEKAYKLCSACTFTVKNTIAKKNSFLLGKQIEEIRKSGKTLLNQSTTAKQTANTLKKCFICSVGCATIYSAYVNHKLWKRFIEEYSLEFMFAIAGSFLTMIGICLSSPRAQQPPLCFSKKIKQEKLTPPRTRVSSGSFAQSHSDTSAGDLSYGSFHSPLNSTVRSDDAGSVCSELERLTANMSSTNNDITDLASDAPPHCSFGLRKSPSAPSMFSSFTTQRSFINKPTLDLTLQQLHVSPQPSSLPSISSSKRPIVSPAKFRNPWTGKPWDNDASSRSSSQSSGVYSRTASMCGDDVASVTSESNPFRTVSNPLTSPKMYSNKFSYIDNRSNVSLSRSRY